MKKPIKKHHWVILAVICLIVVSALGRIAVKTENNPTLTLLWPTVAASPVPTAPLLEPTATPVLPVTPSSKPTPTLSAAALGLMQAPTPAPPPTLRYARGGVKCTGSMEPALTCLDEVTWLRWPPTDDYIEVGDIIDVDTPHCSAAHRIIRTASSARGLVYQLKADVSLVPDACWVSLSDIQLVAVEIHKNVRPWNAPLRDRILASTKTSNAGRLSPSTATYQDQASPPEVLLTDMTGTVPSHRCSCLRAILLDSLNKKENRMATTRIDSPQ